MENEEIIRRVDKGIKKARIEKFSPAIFFRVIVKIPDELIEEAKKHSLEQMAEQWAMQAIRRSDRFKSLRLDFGEAYAKKRRLSKNEFEVAVIYRWG